MNWVVTIYTALLFFVLTPAILLRLPSNGSKYTVAAVHAIVFALVWHFTHKFVWRASMGLTAPAAKVIVKEGVPNPMAHP